MQREEIVKICDSEVLHTAAKLFRTQKEALKIFPGYEGAANLVYEYDLDGNALILRISFTPERTFEQIQAELNFVKYLYEHGIRVSRPVPSIHGNLVETVPAAGIPFYIVTFVKGKGLRVPDNDIRYRIQSLFAELRSLPRDRDSFGLIHGDFNDGNFTVDYANEDITVFDFDDACYFWFMYEIASAWEGGIGRAMFRGLNERKSFMDHYMDQVMEGYHRENSLSADWLARLPLFIKLIQIEEFFHYVQTIDEPNNEFQGELNYKIKCIENEIPFMGFFDKIYAPEKPFSL